MCGTGGIFKGLKLRTSLVNHQSHHNTTGSLDDPICFLYHKVCHDTISIQYGDSIIHAGNTVNYISTKVIVQFYFRPKGPLSYK